MTSPARRAVAHGMFILALGTIAGPSSVATRLQTNGAHALGIITGTRWPALRHAAGTATR